MAPYAWICVDCHHLVSRHGLVPGGDLVDGPYVCRDCDCHITQNHAMVGLNHEEYDEWDGPKWPT